MSIQRETYTELLHAMIVSLVEQRLNLPQVTAVLWACAQPETIEDTHDVTHEVRDMLTDWTELNKGLLIGVETVLLTFNCSNIHGPCKKGRHTVAMTRVIGSMGWDPDDVTSSVSFDDVILKATMHIHPDKGTEDEKVVSHVKAGQGGYSDLIGAFREMFMQQPEEKINKEVDEFRAELDKLFPTPGKEEGS